MMLLALLLQTAVTPAAPAEPLAALKGVVVDAIRDCGRAADGGILVCARDRGFAEGWRTPKLEKPKPIDEGGIRIELKGETVQAPPGG